MINQEWKLIYLKDENKDMEPIKLINLNSKSSWTKNGESK